MLDKYLTSQIQIACRLEKHLVILLLRKMATYRMCKQDFGGLLRRLAFLFGHQVRSCQPSSVSYESTIQECLPMTSRTMHLNRTIPLFVAANKRFIPIAAFPRIALSHTPIALLALFVLPRDLPVLTYPYSKQALSLKDILYSSPLPPV